MKNQRGDTLIKNDSDGQAKEFAFKADSKPDDNGTFVGYPGPYDQRDSMGDTLAPGAFDAVVKSMTAAKLFPPIVWDHQRGNPIGEQVLSVDEKGLRTDGRLWIDPKLGLEDARKAYLLLKNTTYYMSFWSEDWWYVKDNDGGRTIVRVDSIQETTITSHPATRAASLALVASQSEARRRALLPASEFVSDWLNSLKT
jgi:hypothetical protein